MTVTVQQWVDYVFDHTVEDEQWFFDIDAPYLELDATTEATMYAETFERSQELLQPFTPAQLHQGMTFLTSNSCSDHMFSLIDPTVDEAIRLRALRSFLPLFQNTMAKVCTEHLSHLDEPGANPLNLSCYMWWDNLPFPGANRTKDAAFVAAALEVMRGKLAVPHDAVRESALHGLGHWHLDYPREVTQMIREFLRSKRKLRPDLVDYAKAAAEGMVQ